MSKGKGAIDFFLVDDIGEKRTVSAMAVLGRKNKIKTIHAIHKRETPLVEALAKSHINDAIEVDFTGFNKAHPRILNGHIAKQARGNPSAIPQTQTPSNLFVIERAHILWFGLVTLTLLIIVKVII